MFHYFKKTVNPDAGDHDLINDAFYRIQQFWLPTFLIGGILGIPTFLFFAISIPGFLLAASTGESILSVLPFFLIGVALTLLGIFLLWAVTLPWRKKDYVSELVRNAGFYGLYDEDYIRNIGNDIRRGINYRYTYLCLTDHFIIANCSLSKQEPAQAGLWSKYPSYQMVLPFGPIAIPRECIQNIYFNLHTHSEPYPGKIGGITRYYSGIEITMDNGRLIVLPYGTNLSVDHLMKAFQKAGYHIKW